MGVEKGFSESNYYTIQAFKTMQNKSYGWKVGHAKEVAEGFAEEAKERGRTMHYFALQQI